MEDYNGIGRRKKVIVASPQKLPECVKILIQKAIFSKVN
jgi:hypothetical protein